MRRALLLVLVLLPGACRGQPPVRLDEETRFARLVDSLVPVVEAHSGMRFRQAPRAALRTRDQVRGYLLAKVTEGSSPRRLEGLTSAYRLLGLLPDSLDLQAFMVDLLTEQVAGYYDPDSAMLFGVTGYSPLEARLLVAHELVHALQDQYTRLDSIMDVEGHSDRQAAAQAVLEGQAMLVSLKAVVPDTAVLGMSMFWEQARETTRQQTVSQPIFKAAPMVIRESVLFPYLDGAEFMRWWGSSPLADTLPFGPRMPTSSEAIMHPERLVAGDLPLAVRFAPTGDDGAYEDTMGELELRILTAHLTDQAGIGNRPPFGWGGDRYRVTQGPEGPALEWVIVWDDAASARRFGETTGRWLGEQARPGYRTAVEAADVEGRAAHRIVIAPAGWAGWGRPTPVLLGPAAP